MENFPHLFPFLVITTCNGTSVLYIVGKFYKNLERFFFTENPTLNAHSAFLDRFDYRRFDVKRHNKAELL